jgi:CDP-diacylglycerol--serine O-phosphatidyltransferase
MGIRKHIPNLITLGNLFCGCVAVVFAAGENYRMAFAMVALGIFLDFFDGFFARLLNVSSPLGLQLDSLADMVTSGVAPGLVLYKMMTAYSDLPWLPYLGFLVTLGSCYRLANFNIDTRQTDSFIGLPTPANALMVMSLPLVLQTTDSLFVLELLVNPWFLLAVAVFSAFILNAELPLFSLKVKKFSLKHNRLQAVFLLLCILLVAIFRFAGIPLSILSYIVLSLLTRKRT